MRTLFFLTVLLVGIPASAHAQLGISAGLNLDRLSDIELTDGRATFDNSNGWHAEVWYDIGLGNVALRPGVRYLDAGALFDGLSDDVGDVDDNFAINLVEIPLDVRIRFGTPAVRPYALLGPVFRIPFADDDGLNDDLKTFSVAGEAGFGVELPLGRWRLYPELAFTFGLSRFVEDEFRIGGRTFVTDEAQYLNSVRLRLGLGL